MMPFIRNSIISYYLKVRFVVKSILSYNLMILELVAIAFASIHVLQQASTDNMKGEWPSLNHVIISRPRFPALVAIKEPARAERRESAGHAASPSAAQPVHQQRKRYAATLPPVALQDQLTQPRCSVAQWGGRFKHFDQYPGQGLSQVL